MRAGKHQHGSKGQPGILAPCSSGERLCGQVGDKKRVMGEEWWRSVFPPRFWGAGVQTQKTDPEVGFSIWR